MLAKTGKDSAPEGEEHPLEATVRHLRERPPLCGEARFVELMNGMVADFAPRIFAIVQEFGTRVDARIAAWGMAFEDHVDAVGIDGGAIHLGAKSAETLVPRFHVGTQINARLVWVDPAFATPPEPDDDPE